MESFPIFNENIEEVKISNIKMVISEIFNI